MVASSRGASPPPVRRCVVLGASNVARNLSIVLSTALSTARPLDFLTAMGHGRGYGTRSCVLGHSLPSILDCGLWSALDDRPPLTTWAVVTDIGNDLIYGAPPAQVSAWVEEALTRLAPRCDRMVVTCLPLCSVRNLRPNQFLWFRSLFFPGSRLTFDEAVARSCELNDHVQRLAQQFGAALVEPVSDWYGWDPIHITRRQAYGAWRQIFAQLDPEVSDNRVDWRTRQAAWLARPQHWKWFGVPFRRRQPATRWTDGSTLSFF